jgi:tetratricopeptide (TPR) repeat protein
VKSKAAAIQNVKLMIKTEGQKAEEFFQKKTLSIFEDKNYQDYQYKIYSEVLSKLITSVDKITSISSFDSIPITQLKKYPNLIKEMNDMGWTQNFANICMLLNKNVKTNGFLFNESALSNYNRNKSTETQPYSYLFKAFNALIKKDKVLFVELINQCMSTITDKELLSNLDLYVSLVNNASNSNAAFWELVQSGYSDQNSGSLQEAKSSYEKAEKLVNTNEVLYFLLASVNLKLGDRYGAEIYFKRANTINSRFILPKLFQIDNMIDDKDYETALLNANEAIAINPIWYFYFRKANLLFLTGKFDESRMILLNNCVTINPLDYDQYLLLGDVYSSLSDVKNARESYMKAGNIRPNDIAYKRKMELLKLNQAFKNPPAK